MCVCVSVHTLSVLPVTAASYQSTACAWIFTLSPEASRSKMTEETSMLSSMLKLQGDTRVQPADVCFAFVVSWEQWSGVVFKHLGPSPQNKTVWVSPLPTCPLDSLCVCSPCIQLCRYSCGFRNSWVIGEPLETPVSRNRAYTPGANLEFRNRSPMCSVSILCS